MASTDNDASVDAYRWPLISLDFEASGLGERTYPIEVGIAVWDGPKHPIRAWSSLIQPTLEWARDGDWQPESEPVHNIQRAELAEAPTAAEVFDTLTRIVRIGSIAFCDGGRHDSHWLQRLVRAAQGQSTIVLAHWDFACLPFSERQMGRYLDFRNETPVPHRAGPDAILNMRAFAHGLGFDRLDIDDLDVAA
jgi:hypothetical protein